MTRCGINNKALQYFDSRDQNGCTPLMRAIEANNHNKVTQLLESGANPFLLSNDKKTAMEYAFGAKTPSPNIIAILYKYGAGIFGPARFYKDTVFPDDMPPPHVERVKTLKSNILKSQFAAGKYLKDMMINTAPIPQTELAKRVLHVKDLKTRIDSKIWNVLDPVDSVVFKAAWRGKFEDLARHLQKGEYLPPENLLEKHPELHTSVVDILFYKKQLHKLFDRSFWPVEAGHKMDELFRALPENYKYACADAYQKACDEWGDDLPDHTKQAGDDFNAESKEQSYHNITALHERLKPRPKRIKFRSRK